MTIRLSLSLMVMDDWLISESDTYFIFGQLSSHCTSSSILTCWTWSPLSCSPFSANCSNCCFKTPNDYDNCTTCWMTMTIVGVSGKELAPGTVELYDRVQFTLWLSTFLSGRRQLASCGHVDASSWMFSRSDLSVTNCL